jgi:hypothetical protein
MAGGERMPDTGTLHFSLMSCKAALSVGRAMMNLENESILELQTTSWFDVIGFPNFLTLSV